MSFLKAICMVCMVWMGANGVTFLCLFSAVWPGEVFHARSLAGFLNGIHQGHLPIIPTGSCEGCVAPQIQSEDLPSLTVCSSHFISTSLLIFQGSPVFSLLFLPDMAENQKSFWSFQ